MAVDPVAVMAQYQPMQRSTLAAGIESMMGIAYKYNRDALVSYYGGMTPLQRQRELDRMQQRRNRLLIQESFVTANEGDIQNEINRRKAQAGVQQRAEAKTSKSDKAKAERDSNKLKQKNKEALEDLYGDATIEKVAQKLHDDGYAVNDPKDVKNVTQLREYIYVNGITDAQLETSIINTFVDTEHQTVDARDAKLLLPIDRDAQTQKQRKEQQKEPETNIHYAEEYIRMHDLMSAKAAGETNYTGGPKRYGDNKTYQEHRGETDDVEIDNSYEAGTTGTMPGRKSDEQIEREVRKEYEPQTLEAKRREEERQRQIKALGEKPKDSDTMSELDRRQQMMRETGVTNPLLQTYMRPADMDLPELRADRDIVDIMTELKDKREDRKSDKEAFKDEKDRGMYPTGYTLNKAEKEENLITGTLGGEDDDADGVPNYLEPNWFQNTEAFEKGVSQRRKRKEKETKREERKEERKDTREQFKGELGEGLYRMMDERELRKTVQMQTEPPQPTVQMPTKQLQPEEDSLVSEPVDLDIVGMQEEMEAKRQALRGDVFDDTEAIEQAEKTREQITKANVERRKQELEALTAPLQKRTEDIGMVRGLVEDTFPQEKIDLVNRVRVLVDQPDAKLPPHMLASLNIDELKKLISDLEAGASQEEPFKPQVETVQFSGTSKWGGQGMAEVFRGFNDKPYKVVVNHPQGLFTYFYTEEQEQVGGRWNPSQEWRKIMNDVTIAKMEGER